MGNYNNMCTSPPQHTYHLYGVHQLPVQRDLQHPQTITTSSHPLHVQTYIHYILAEETLHTASAIVYLQLRAIGVIGA